MKNLVRTFIAPYFAFAASVCSIVGLVIILLSNKNATIVALMAFCLFLLIILTGVLLGIASQTDDGIKSTFETFRLIQCKRIFLSQIEYRFKWSGTIMPRIFSNSQRIENIKHYSDAQQWDSAILRFKKPLTYNESTVVHIKTENDDHDGTAKPFIYCKLESPIDIMQFRVLLAYKPTGYTEKAIFERKLIDQEIDAEFEYIESIEFNSLYKQYYHVIVDPAPGYIYRLRWKK